VKFAEFPELRIEERVKEAKKLGFTRAIVPKKNLGGWRAPKGIEIIGVDTIKEVVQVIFSQTPQF